MKITLRPLATIHPYPENPRVITPEAIAKVAKSLESFGFRQPIVVDAEGVIIIGHVRYQAALQLGLDTVPVHVADDQCAYDPATKTLKIGEVLLRALFEGNESILMGQNLACDKGNTVLLGRGMTANVANAIIITNGGAAPLQQDCVVIGRPSVPGAQRSVHVGRLGGASGFAAASYGYDARATHARSVAIGSAARSSKEDRATFGSDAVPIEVEATSHFRTKHSIIGGDDMAPDAELDPGQFAISYDPTTSRLIVRAKHPTGGIQNGEVVLA